MSNTSRITPDLRAKLDEISDRAAHDEGQRDPHLRGLHKLTPEEFRGKVRAHAYDALRGNQSGLVGGKRARASQDTLDGLWTWAQEQQAKGRSEAFLDAWLAGCREAEIELNGPEE